MVGICNIRHNIAVQKKKILFVDAGSLFMWYKTQFSAGAAQRLGCKSCGCVGQDHIYLFVSAASVETGPL